jgi:hypothetical protein
MRLPRIIYRSLPLFTFYLLFLSLPLMSQNQQLFLVSVDSVRAYSVISEHEKTFFESTYAHHSELLKIEVDSLQRAVTHFTTHYVACCFCTTSTKDSLAKPLLKWKESLAQREANLGEIKEITERTYLDFTKKTLTSLASDYGSSLFIDSDFVFPNITPSGRYKTIVFIKIINSSQRIKHEIEVLDQLLSEKIFRLVSE